MFLISFVIAVIIYVVVVLLGVLIPFPEYLLASISTFIGD